MAHDPKNDPRHHGVSGGRGCGHLGVGKFGRMFDLPPLYSSDGLLEALGGPGGLMDTVGATPDTDIPAGYTFFAQFVDHDVTLDTNSQLVSDQVQDVEHLPNLRSASLDLDCVYGFGPEASPHLYDADEKLLTGTDTNPDDVARGPDDTALIGDPRNDENLFVSQLQLVFHRLHNRLIDEGLHFEEAQRAARHHYQYVVLHDFLARICDPTVFRFALERLHARTFPLIVTPEAHGLDMPVEFSVAAYRFGHSMVRSVYAVNAKRRKVELFSETDGTIGFTRVPKALTVDWKFLLDLDGKSYVKSKKIDQRLARELNDLPFMRGAEPDPLKRSLAFRNLVRSRSLGLPSGRDVACALAEAGYPVDPDVDLKLSQMEGWKGLGRPLQEELRAGAPLFFHLLRESTFGETLGPVGSAILLEVFGAMLVHCETSYLSAEGGFAPRADIVRSDHRLTLADLVVYAGG